MDEAETMFKLTENSEVLFLFFSLSNDLVVDFCLFFNFLTFFFNVEKMLHLSLRLPSNFLLSFSPWAFK